MQGLRVFLVFSPFAAAFGAPESGAAMSVTRCCVRRVRPRGWRREICSRLSMLAEVHRACAARCVTILIIELSRAFAWGARGTAVFLVFSSAGAELVSQFACFWARPLQYHYVHTHFSYARRTRTPIFSNHAFFDKLPENFRSNVERTCITRC